MFWAETRAKSGFNQFRPLITKSLNALSYASASLSAHLGVHLCECWSQLIRLPSEDDGLRAGVQRRHLHRHPCCLQDFLKGVALWTYDVLMLRLFHLYRDGGGFPLLYGEKEQNYTTTIYMKFGTFSN